MWSMGKVFDNPEVVRVYVGSFWDKPLKHQVRAIKKAIDVDLSLFVSNTFSLFARSVFIYLFCASLDMEQDEGAHILHVLVVYFACFDSIISHVLSSLA